MLARVRVYARVWACVRVYRNTGAGVCTLVRVGADVRAVARANVRTHVHDRAGVCTMRACTGGRGSVCVRKVTWAFACVDVWTSGRVGVEGGTDVSARARAFVCAYMRRCALGFL